MHIDLEPIGSERFVLLIHYNFQNGNNIIIIHQILMKNIWIEKTHRRVAWMEVNCEFWVLVEIHFEFPSGDEIGNVHV